MRLFLRSILILLAVLTGLYFVAAPFFMPKVIGRAVQQAFTESVDGKLSLGVISFNPFLLRADFADVAVDDPAGRRVLAVPRLTVDLGWRTLWGNRLVVDRLVFDRPAVLLAFDQEGRLSLATMIKPAGRSDDAPLSSSGFPSGFSSGLAVGGITITAADIRYLDHTGYSTRARGVDLALGPFQTDGLAGLSLDAFEAQYAGGKVIVEGAIKTRPFEIDLSLALEDISAAEAIGFIDLGTFHPVEARGSGALRLRLGQDTEVEASLSLTDVVLAGDDLLPDMAADAVALEGLHYREADDCLTIARLGLTRPKITVVRPVPTESGSDEDTIRQLVTLIDQGRIEDGSFTFIDRKVGAAPLPVDSLNGTFENVEIGYVIATRFNFDARIDGVSPIAADGDFSLGSYLDADARMTVGRLDHKWVSPYSVSVLGRPSEGGTAHLAFDYDVEIDEIDGLNTMVFNNWVWGPTAPAYEGDPPPVKKAFDILETSRGQVQLVVPVEGDVSDPDFKVDALVRRATSKVITGIVAAPFKLIGNILGGSKDAFDFDKFVFEPSSALLTPVHKSQLSLLAEALKERPKITLEIDGVSVPGVDLVPAGISAGTQAGAPTDTPIDAMGLKKLANQRADAVYQYLLSSGVSADRLTQGVRPIGDKKTPSVRIDINK